MDNETLTSETTFTMITLTGKSLHSKYNTPRIELKAERAYRTGDTLNGEVGITLTHARYAFWVVAKLEYVMESRGRKSVNLHDSVILAANLTMRVNETKTFPLRFKKELDRPNFKGQNMVSYWRIRVVLEKDTSASKMQFDERFLPTVTRPEEVTFFPQVNYSLGVLRAEPTTVRVPWVNAKSLVFGGVAVAYLIFLSISSYLAAEDGNLGFYQFLIVMIVCYLAFTHLLRLRKFSTQPLEISSGGDGSLRIRTLDRGNNDLDKAVVGYRLIETTVYTESNKSRIKEKIIYNNYDQYGHIARRDGAFHNLTLSPPQGDWPTNISSDRQGYRWELYFTNGSTETWPLTLHWENLEKGSRLGSPETLDLGARPQVQEKVLKEQRNAE